MAIPTMSRKKIRVPNVLATAVKIPNTKQVNVADKKRGRLPNRSASGPVVTVPTICPANIDEKIAAAWAFDSPQSGCNTVVKRVKKTISAVSASQKRKAATYTRV